MIGPKIMKNREPLNLKYPMVLYNLAMTFLNLYILVEVCDKNYTKLTSGVVHQGLEGGL